VNTTALTLGDLLALAAVTVIGFASHGEFNTAFLLRMTVVFLPLCVAWFLLAPRLGLFDAHLASSPRQLWRPAFAMLFAGPLAALLRAMALNTSVIPNFALVLTVIATLALTLWRLAYILVRARAGQ
jgi:hypothetical protein